LGWAGWIRISGRRALHIVGGPPQPPSVGAKAEGCKGISGNEFRRTFARERLLVGHRFLERMIVFVVLIIGPFKRNLEVHVHGAMMTNYDLQSPLMAFRFLAPATIRKGLRTDADAEEN
jgi:hypothetical protein